MTIVLNEDLSQQSLLVVYAAMAIFTLAFLFSVYHLSQAASLENRNLKSVLATERIALALTILGTLILAIGVFMRGFAASRVPWANLYEYSITGALILMMI